MKEVTKQQWYIYMPLLKTIMLGMGLLYFINAYLKLNLALLLVTLEVIVVVVGINCMNQYKKCLQFYFLVGGIIGIVIVGLAYFGISIINTCGESITWLREYKGIESQYVFYKAFCVSMILAIVVLIPVYVIQNYLRLQVALSLVILISMVSLAVNNIEMGKESIVFLLSYVVWILIQVTSGTKQGEKRQYNREASTFLLPFAIIIAIGAILGPASEKPISWQGVINKFNKMVDTINDVTLSFQEKMRGGTGEFQLTFSEKSQVELGTELYDSNKILLEVKVLANKVNPKINQLYDTHKVKQTPIPYSSTYLKGNVRNIYTGQGWDRKDDFEIEGEKEYEVAYKELLYALYRSGIHTKQLLYHPVCIEIAFKELHSKSVFYTNNMERLFFKKEEKLPDIIGNQITFKKTKRNLKYQVSYLETNLDNKIIQDYLRDLEGFHYTSQEYQEEEQDRPLEDDEVFWQAYSREQLPYFFKNTKFQKQLYERAQYIKEVYTALPTQLPTRIYDLAHNITKGSTSTYDRLKAIEDYLKQYTYTRTPKKVPKGVDFVDYFLFEAQEGYCTSFASAMAVLARCEGIPTRYVEGIVVTYDQKKKTARPVTGDRLHAWVEAYIEGYGWIVFEPTPANSGNGYSENWNISLPSSGESTDALEGNMSQYAPQYPPPTMPSTEKSEVNIDTVSRKWQVLWTTGITLGIACLLLIMYLVIMKIQYKRGWKKANKSERAKIAWKAILLGLEKLGYEQIEDESMLEYAKRIDDRNLLEYVSCQKIVNIYLRYRYGGYEVTEGEIEYFEVYLKSVRDLLRREKNKLNYWLYDILVLFLK